MWTPIISKIKNIPASWEGESVLLGGRVSLINLMLNSMPLYIFSFLKTPKNVVQEITRSNANSYGMEKTNLREFVG